MIAQNRANWNHPWLVKLLVCSAARDALAFLPMKTRTVVARPPATRLALAAALAAALVAATTVVNSARAAEPQPLRATRFVSIGLSGSDALAIATDRCVDRIEARSADAVVSCRLATRRARVASMDPIALSVARGRRDYAFALGNLAVAQHLAGDTPAAQATLDTALGYAPDEPVLVSNLAALEARRLAKSTTAAK